jgi:hypothetical protein
MAVAPCWTSNTAAVRSFTDDVLAVAVELGLAGDVATFTASLRELVELASEHVVLVDDGPDGTLVFRTGAGAFRVVIEAS